MYHTKTTVRLLLAALILTTLALLTAVYIVSGVLGQLSYPNIYPSRAFTQDPGRAIAASLIPIIAFLVVIIVLERLNRTSPYIRSRRDNIIAGFTLFFLFLFFIGLLGVGAVAVTALDWLHWVATGLAAAGAALMLLLLTYWDYRMRIIRPRWLRWFRILIAAFAFIVAIVLAATTVSSVIIVSAICELVLIGLFLLYFLSYAHESEFPIKSERPRADIVLGVPVSNPPV